MLSTSLFALAALAVGADAHYRLLQPTWRGSSFDAPANQYIYPCANVNETTSIANRTLWPPSGGSVIINGTHASAFTSINLALGTNATNFNITLVEMFNQTGAGVFCLKEAGRAGLEAGFKKAGYSGLDDARINGLQASVQVIQLGHSGSALYNCADIVFNSTAQLLPDDQCKNGTGVGGVAIESVGANASSPSGSAASPAASAKTGTAGGLAPALGAVLVAALLALGL